MNTEEEKSIRLLDCTLRDGAYITEGNFGTPAIKGIISKMQDANVDFIECGWLKNNPHKEGSSYYHVPSDLEQYLISKSPRATYLVMIDWDRYDLDNLPPYDGKSIDGIRIVFPHGKHHEGIAVGEQIKKKGYQVFFQASNTLDYSNDDLVDLAKEVNRIKPVSLSIVDTFGSMYEEDLDRIISVLNQNLDDGIKLGFHSHNNQQLSFALTMYFVKSFETRNKEIIVDASLCGMGRGAGNATIELVANRLNQKYHCNYDMNAIMDAIDAYMEYFQETYSWGYSTPNFIAGTYCCHVNNIAYLLKNHRTNAQDMRNIIESLSHDDRKNYDYDLLESKYLENQNRVVDDSVSMEVLRQEMKGRKVLLIAPGETTATEQDKISRNISAKNPLVIDVNAINTLYRFDYLFLISAIRYDYAKSVYPKQFNDAKKILLSNIKTEPCDDETIINFNRVIKRGWPHFDNAVITCLRLLDKLHVETVIVAGFDGFKNKYNESYADKFLPTLNPDNKWQELNDEIANMFDDFLRSTESMMKIEFLTESRFDSSQKK